MNPPIIKRAAICKKKISTVNVRQACWASHVVVIPEVDHSDHDEAVPKCHREHRQRAGDAADELAVLGSITSASPREESGCTHKVGEREADEAC
jgi:hypothetical protein